MKTHSWKQLLTVWQSADAGTFSLEELRTILTKHKQTHFAIYIITMIGAMVATGFFLNAFQEVISFFDTGWKFLLVGIVMLVPAIWNSRSTKELPLFLRQLLFAVGGVGVMSIIWGLDKSLDSRKTAYLLATIFSIGIFFAWDDVRARFIAVWGTFGCLCMYVGAYNFEESIIPSLILFVIALALTVLSWGTRPTLTGQLARWASPVRYSAPWIAIIALSSFRLYQEDVIELLDLNGAFWGSNSFSSSMSFDPHPYCFVALLVGTLFILFKTIQSRKLSGASLLCLLGLTAIATLMGFFTPTVLLGLLFLLIGWWQQHNVMLLCGTITGVYGVGLFYFNLPWDSLNKAFFAIVTGGVCLVIAWIYQPKSIKVEPTIVEEIQDVEQ